MAESSRPTCFICSRSDSERAAVHRCVQERIINGERKPELCRNGHSICTTCLDWRFRSFCTIEQVRPYCCDEDKPLDIKSYWAVFDLFSPEYIKYHDEKVVEYQTPQSDRTYCANDRCRRFLDSESPQNGSVKYCLACCTMTCHDCTELVPEETLYHTCAPLRTTEGNEEPVHEWTSRNCQFCGQVNLNFSENDATRCRWCGVNCNPPSQPVQLNDSALMLLRLGRFRF